MDSTYRARLACQFEYRYAWFACLIMSGLLRPCVHYPYQWFARAKIRVTLELNTPNSSSTDRTDRKLCLATFETWTPILDPLLRAVELSGVVTSLAGAPTVHVVLLPLFSGLESLPFFSFTSYPSFYRIDGLWSSWDIVLTDILALLWLWLDKLICFLVNVKNVEELLGVLSSRVTRILARANHWYG